MNCQVPVLRRHSQPPLCLLWRWGWCPCRSVSMQRGARDAARVRRTEGDWGHSGWSAAIKVGYVWR